MLFWSAVLSGESNWYPEQLSPARGKVAGYMDGEDGVEEMQRQSGNG